MVRRSTFIAVIDNTIELLVVLSGFVLMSPIPNVLFARLKIRSG